MAQVSGGSTILRTEKGGSRIERQCPPCVIDYQKFMGGVDRGDQLESYYNMGRRCLGSTSSYTQSGSTPVETCQSSHPRQPV